MTVQPFDRLQRVPEKPSAGKNELRDACLVSRNSALTNQVSMRDTAVAQGMGIRWQDQMPDSHHQSRTIT